MSLAQKIALTIGILGFVATGGTQLTDIFSPLGSLAPLIVKEIVSLAGFVSGILGIVLTFMTVQASQLKAVQDMPGVEKIVANAKANATLATMVLDETNPKIEAAPGAAVAIQKTANINS